jgi:hypothetical protein
MDNLSDKNYPELWLKRLFAKQKYCIAHPCNYYGISKEFEFDNGITTH